MGIGKTIEGSATIYLCIQYKINRYMGRRRSINITFWPSLWITLRELECQTLEDFMKGFKGLFKLYVLTASRKTNVYPPEVTVINTPTQWKALVEELWENRYNPEVSNGIISFEIRGLTLSQNCKTVIVTSYGLARSRWLQHNTYFQTLKGDIIDAGRMSRKTKHHSGEMNWSKSYVTVALSHGARTTPQKSGEQDNPEMLLEEEAEDDSHQADNHEADNHEEDQEDDDQEDEDQEDEDQEDDDQDESTPSKKSRAPGPQTPQVTRKSRNHTLAQAIKKIRKSLGKELQNRTPHNTSETIYETQADSRMLYAFFKHMDITTGNAAMEFFKNRREDLPSSSWVAHSLSEDSFQTANGQWLQFETTTYDEMQNLRNRQSSDFFLAKLLPTKAILGMSGTPLFNLKKDCNAYMDLFASVTDLDAFFKWKGKSPTVADACTSSEEVVDQGYVVLKVGSLISKEINMPLSGYFFRNNLANNFLGYLTRLRGRRSAPQIP